MLALVPGKSALGSQWFLVGGAIRDALLGKPVSDFDVVVPRDPEGILPGLLRRVSRAAVVRLDHDVIRVVISDVQLDLVRMQGQTIEQDLSKRDFTINAMAMTPRGRLIDPFGGLDDIDAGLIRTPNPENLAEDPLRCLRAFRFVSENGFRIDDATLKAIQQNAPGLERVAGERIWFELRKTLAGPEVKTALETGWAAGVLRVLLPELEDADQVLGGNHLLGHMISTAHIAAKTIEHMDITPFWHYRKHLEILQDPDNRAVFVFAALLHDIGKPKTYTQENGQVHFYGHDALGAAMVKRIAKRLKTSKAQRDALVLLVSNHMHPHFLGQEDGPTKRALNRFLRRTGQWAFPIILMAYADALSSFLSHQGVVAHLILAKALHDFITEQEAQKKKQPRLVSGHDLIAMGLKPGPSFKTLLQEIDDLRAEGKVKTRDQALERLRKMVEQMEQG